MKDLKIAEKIYAELGDRTENYNVVLKSVYQRSGVRYAKSIGGVFSLRIRGTEKHFGNPFSSIDHLVKKDNLIKVATTKDSVVEFINWVMTSSDNRAVWIRRILDEKILVGKSIVYYKELREPSHATALGYLIQHWNKL